MAPSRRLLLVAGAFALGGMPPFNIFISEFWTVAAAIAAGKIWLIVACLLLLTVGLAAFVRMIAGAVFGEAPALMKRGDVGALALAPVAVLLVLILVLGVHLPAPVAQLPQTAAGVVAGQQTAGPTMAGLFPPLPRAWRRFQAQP